MNKTTSSADLDSDVKYCAICLEESIPFQRTAMCQKHQNFCVPCCRAFVTLNINEAKVPVVCPEISCKNIVQDSIIEAVLQDHVMYAKYQKFVQLKKDPTLRECSQCQMLNAKTSTPLKSSDRINILYCACGHSYCYLHGDAHLPTTSCEEHEASKSPEEKQNEQLSILIIQEESKACPTCQTRIYKSGGCDHIVCTTCEQDFCFECGTNEYLKGTVFRSCSKCGANYFDHRYQSKLQCRIICCFPILLPLYLIWMALSICCFIVSIGCGCCCECGKNIPFDDEIEGKTHANCGDLFRCVGQVLCAPIIQVFMFFPLLHRCLGCCFERRELRKMGLQ
jgi:hypothetical protein